MNFIFGYGSLIHPDRRGVSAKDADVFPVRVLGVKREWNVVLPSSGMTTLGATFVQDDWCNGVLIPVWKNELAVLDKRESAYDRVPLPWDTVEVLDKRALLTEKLWIYQAKEPGRASESCPIAQSYADVFLAGCLHYGLEFAKEAVATTHGWEGPWLNDLDAPRYRRALKPNPQAEAIDQLLDELVPDRTRII